MSAKRLSVLADGFYFKDGWLDLDFCLTQALVAARGATTRGGGYFFPLRRKKVTKKGATSLEEAIFF
ncbi:MAG: hypothetical protein LBO63_01525, partial [Oscillospiraceae bacterium]|nr:hypothetical protein [Oscillospiraceae bacterium]